MKPVSKAYILSIVICMLSMYGYSQAPTISKKDEVFIRAEQMPEYETGKEQLGKDIADCVVYPKKAIELGISGTVVVKCVLIQMVKFVIL